MVIGAALVVLACGSENTEDPPAAAPECSSGERSSCPCPEDRTGFRACLSSGRFEEHCQCPDIPPGQTEIDGGCPTGRFYVDADGDGFGVGEFVDACLGEDGGTPKGYASRAGDCDDAEPRAFPGQTKPQSGLRAGVGGGDFNCDGNEVRTFTQLAQCAGVCGLIEGWADVQVAPCGETGSYLKDCLSENGGCTSVVEGRPQTCL